MKDLRCDHPDGLASSCPACPGRGQAVQLSHGPACTARPGPAVPCAMLQPAAIMVVAYTAALRTMEPQSEGPCAAAPHLKAELGWAWAGRPILEHGPGCRVRKPALVDCTSPQQRKPAPAAALRRGSVSWSGTGSASGPTRSLLSCPTRPPAGRLPVAGGLRLRVRTRAARRGPSWPTRYR
jgi:hypothetical protein